MADGAEHFVVATVVRAQRPTSVRPGDRAVLRADGTVDGFVGGVCAAEAVRRYGLQCLRSGQPLLLRILPGDEPKAVSEEGAVTMANPCLSGGGLEIFLEPHCPPPLLVVVGQTPISAALAELAPAVGYAAQVLPPDGPLPPGTSAVVVAAGGRDEHPVLRAAVAAGVPYIGLVASKVRGAAVLDALHLSTEQRATIRTPAGLAIGARTPAESALAILAEITATRPAPPADDTTVLSGRDPEQPPAG
jgi:xanthine dehydrogenase accessory factor